VGRVWTDQLVCQHDPNNMGAANITTEGYINPGIGGVRANHCNNLVFDQGRDAVPREPEDIPIGRDWLCDYQESW